MTITTLSTQPNSVTRPTTFDTDSDTFHAELPTMITEINAALAALNAIAAGTAAAIPYTFSTTITDADPGAGFLRLDNATQASATTIRTDLVGSDGVTYTDVLALLDDSTSTVKGFIQLENIADPTKWLIFTVASLASPSGYKNITVACVASSGANPLVNGDTVVLKFTRTGDKGDSGSSAMSRSARTGDTILGAADQGKLIDVTSGTFSQTYAAAATLGDGWWCYYRNSGTGVVTHDPDGAELIDGAATSPMGPHRTWLIQCDGAAFYTVPVSGEGEIVLSSATIAASAASVLIPIPAGYNDVVLELNGLYANSPSGLVKMQFNTPALVGVDSIIEIRALSSAGSVTSALEMNGGFSGGYVPIFGANGYDIGDGSGRGASFTIELTNPGGTANKTFTLEGVSSESAGAPYPLITIAGQGQCRATAAVTAIDIIATNFLLMGGKYKLKGTPA